MASVLSRAGTRILDERDGRGGRGDDSDGGARGRGERETFRSVDPGGRDNDTGSKRICGSRKPRDGHVSDGGGSCASRRLSRTADVRGRGLWHGKRQCLGDHANACRTTGGGALGGIAELRGKSFRCGRTGADRSSRRSHGTIFVAIPDYRGSSLARGGSMGFSVGAN